MDDPTSFWAKWGQPIIDILSSTPGVAAFLVGFIVGFLGTQWIKHALPPDWSEAKRRTWVLIIAFFMYAVPCWLLWPLGWDWHALSGINRYLVVILGLLAGVALGFGSMFFYGLVMRYLYEKGWAQPEKWSAEAKAEVKRQKLVQNAAGEQSLVDEDDDTEGNKTVVDATKLAALRDSTRQPEDPKS